MPRKDKPKKGRKKKRDCGCTPAFSQTVAVSLEKVSHKESPRMPAPYPEMPQTCYSIPAGAHGVLSHIERRALGEVKGIINLRKFGHNACGTSETAISWGDILWRPTTASTLRVKAGNTNDTDGGTGAHTVLVQGVDENWEFVQETLTTNGTSAGAAGTQTFLRVYRVIVTAAGSTNNNVADLTIETSDGGADVASIEAAHGQSEITHVVVPMGYVFVPRQVIVSDDANKSAVVRIYFANKASNVVRRIQELYGVTRAITIETLGAQVWPEGSELWMTGQTASGTADLSTWVDGFYMRISDGT